MAESERSEHSLAIFVDFENLALGFQGRRERFDIERVLKRLVEKGKVVVKKAYADWNRYASYTANLHEAAIELIEIPHRSQTGKNSADIRLCVDAMDLAYSKDHIDTFVVVSGDSDFSPLVSKLKELGKHVIGLGMQGSTSELLRDNCDEFIYYEDLGEPEAALPHLDPQLPETKRKAFALLMDSLQALRRENKEHLWSSMIKDTMKRKKPSFNESYHGYSSFSALLEDAQRQGLIELETDKRSGTYVVTRFGSELKTRPARTERVRSTSTLGRTGQRTASGAGRRSTAPRGQPADRRTSSRLPSSPPVHEGPINETDVPTPRRVIREIKEEGAPHDLPRTRSVAPAPHDAPSDQTPAARSGPRRSLPTSAPRPAEGNDASAPAHPPRPPAASPAGDRRLPPRRPRPADGEPADAAPAPPPEATPAGKPAPHLEIKGFGAGIFD